LKIKRLKKRTWVIGITLIATLTLGSGVGIAWSRTATAEQLEEYAAYSCTLESEIDYQVHLLPNDVFQENVLESGRAYLSNMTDYLTAEVSYHFEGKQDAFIDGQYSAVAYLTAMTSGEGKNVVWDREFELLAPQRFSYQGSELIIQETIKIPFLYYKEFAEDMREKTEFVPGELDLKVNYELNYRIQTDEGSTEGEINPHMVYSLRGNTFVVKGNLAESNSAEITSKKEVPVLLVQQARTGFAVSTGVFGVFLIAFLFLTVPQEQKVNPQEQKASRFIKKHGERIVAVVGSSPFRAERIVEVKEFADLLKVADELHKPVFYYHKPSEGALSEHYFMVLEQEKGYRYSL